VQRANIIVPVIVLVLLAAYGGYWLWRGEEDRTWALTLTAGTPARAIPLLIANGCAGCHHITGVPGARGKTGPPLTGISERQYVAGVLANTPANLIRWIRYARAINPQTAMPSTNVSEQDARDMAAYLYSLN
jgi:mono/diheme cytochrome c family protein